MPKTMLTDNFHLFLGDADRAAAKIKSKLPGSSPNAEKEFKNMGQEAGAKLDKAVRSPPFLVAPLLNKIN